MMQTRNYIFNTSVQYSALSLQFCLIWRGKDQDLDNSGEVHVVCVCVCWQLNVLSHIFSAIFLRVAAVRKSCFHSY